jgi:hypothetical protein
MTPALYARLADLVALVHAFYVLFVVAGQLLIMIGWARGWQWTGGWWLRGLHLGAIALVVVEAWSGVFCPLTRLEGRLRELAGSHGYGQSFIGYWVDRLLFYQAPAWVFTAAYTAFGLLVLATLLLYPPRARCRRV